MMHHRQYILLIFDVLCLLELDNFALAEHFEGITFSVHDGHIHFAERTSANNAYELVVLQIAGGVLNGSPFHCR